MQGTDTPLAKPFDAEPSTRFGSLDRLARHATTHGGFAAVAIAIGRRSGTAWQSVYGHAEITPETRVLQASHRFDLASLTKVLVTVPLVLQLVEAGRLHLGQRVASIIPAFEAGGKDAITIGHLLTHTSGLPAHIHFWQTAMSALDVRRAVLATPPASAPDLDVVYSDLGFMTLAFILQEVTGLALDQLASKNLFEPLGLSGTGFCPGPEASCVATEVVKERGGTVVGTVHDENANALNGIAGHAGLFAPIGDVARLAMLWGREGTIDGVRCLSRASVMAATRDHTSLVNPRASRSLGWVRAPNPFWAPADLASPGSYGHTGFTGTSVLIDPELDAWVVLLTNRVHPTRHGDSLARIRALRASVHNAAIAALVD
ncbi:MAG: class A beta-lactamase-related serine hydrolase [Chloroflexi bacterium]|nr:class A beta-lactamase-related serine hydrolase [Chloroflexota bacterium]